MYSSQLSPLLIPSDDVGTTAVPDQVPEVLRLDENVQLSTATDKNKSDQKSTASTAAELLEGVRDGPLKSVAGGLHFILENCKVGIPSCTSNPKCLQSFQQTEVDQQAIESLAPRVKALSESLCVPISWDDVNEKEREKKLEQ